MVILIVISFCSPGYSQVKFGFRGGLNLANVSEDLGGTEAIDFDGVPIVVDINQSNRTTFNVGGLVEFRLSPMFALQVNALYNQKGMKLEGDFNTEIVEQGIPISIRGSVVESINLTYLSFPVLAKVEFGQSNIKPYIIAGPEIGFLLSATNIAESTAEGEAMGQTVGPFTVEQEEDIKDSFETFELALNFGVGLMIPLGNVDIFADAQYSLGLTKINKESISGGDDIKNQVIMIDVGILFGGKN
jgi:hypothetical protein